MLHLLNTEMQRTVLQFARSRMGPPSLNWSRLLDPNQNTEKSRLGVSEEEVGSRQLSTLARDTRLEAAKPDPMQLCPSLKSNMLLCRYASNQGSRGALERTPAGQKIHAQKQRLQQQQQQQRRVKLQKIQHERSQKQQLQQQLQQLQKQKQRDLEVHERVEKQQQQIQQQRQTQEKQVKQYKQVLQVQELQQKQQRKMAQEQQLERAQQIQDHQKQIQHERQQRDLEPGGSASQPQQQTGAKDLPTLGDRLASWMPTGKEIKFGSSKAQAFDDIPGPSGMTSSIPFAGTRLLYFPFSDHKTSNMGDMLSNLQETYGSILRVKLGSQWVVMIEQLSDIDKVTKAAAEEDKKTEVKATTCPGEPGLSGMVSGYFQKLEASKPLCFKTQGRVKSNAHRAVAINLNNPKYVTQYVKMQDLIADDLVKEISKQKPSPAPAELQNLFRRYALECAGQMCFNERPGFLGEHYSSKGDTPQVVDSYRTAGVCEGEAKTGTKLLYLLFDDPFSRRFNSAYKVAQQFEQKMMRQTILNAINGKGKKMVDRSLLVSLLDDTSLNDTEIEKMVHQLMTIGGEGGAASLQMLLYSLATNEDKQEKLVKNIREKLGPEFTLTPQNMVKLVYLNAVVKESSRLHFPMASGARVILSNDIVLSNYLVPAGTPIVVNSRRTAKNPAFFENPDFFLPERWLGEGSKKIPPQAHMPFGFSGNHCPAQSFAMQNYCIAIVKILQKFKVELPAKYMTKGVDLVHCPFLQPKEPLPFKFTPRTYFTVHNDFVKTEPNNNN